MDLMGRVPEYNQHSRTAVPGIFLVKKWDAFVSPVRDFILEVVHAGVVSDGRAYATFFL